MRDGMDDRVLFVILAALMAFIVTLAAMLWMTR